MSSKTLHSCGAGVYSITYPIAAAESLLGIFVLSQWPLANVWVPGTFVGIDLIANGIAPAVLARCLCP
jgi:uncharacterized membrane protein HdeD (DUF308 family)